MYIVILLIEEVKKVDRWKMLSTEVRVNACKMYSNLTKVYFKPFGNHSNRILQNLVRGDKSFSHQSGAAPNVSGGAVLAIYLREQIRML